MISTPAIIDVPLRTDQDGVIRVGQTRVTLETVIAHHLAGDSPETIHHGFPTVALSDIYAVIAYYLTHRESVDEYIAQVEREGEEIRRKFEALPTSKPLSRDELMARREAKKRVARR
jgi:uncharacterized protein (DUF433 family)